MKTKRVSIILCIFLLGSILPSVVGQTDNAIVAQEDTHIDPLANEPVLKYFFIGRIRNLDLDYEYNSSNYTAFTAVRVLEIGMYRYGYLSRFFGVTHYRNTRISIPNEYFQFRGILRDRFICGVFQYIYD